MPRPRIFISSTYYDFKHVRSDIERAITNLGYEAIRHETGAVPYSKDENLESGAYREVELSDVIVFVMGGRFGNKSKDNPGYSISQSELKRALDKGIQVFIFVESSVHNEFNTYKLNKNVRDTQYASVDDVAVFDFLEELYSLQQNNPITPFETTSDITKFLREQFAGLFQRFLQGQQRERELQVLDEMNSVATALKEMVRFLDARRGTEDNETRSMLPINHPIYRRLKTLTNTSYRVFFSTRSEMEAWLKAREWKKVREDALDENSVEEWIRESTYLSFARGFFDERGNLEPISEEEWKDGWIRDRIYDVNHQEPSP